MTFGLSRGLEWQIIEANKAELFWFSWRPESLAFEHGWDQSVHLPYHSSCSERSIWNSPRSVFQRFFTFYVFREQLRSDKELLLKITFKILTMFLRTWYPSSMLNFTELGKLSSQSLEFYMKASFSVLCFMQKTICICVIETLFILQHKQINLCYHQT